LVKPTPNYYEALNISIHGLTDNDTKNAKTFKQQWKSLKKYFHNETIVAHNAAFDCSVLRFTLDDAKLDYPDIDYYCTMRLAQEVLKLPAHTLADVSKHFKIKLNHHNAESDAQAAALIAINLCEKFKAGSLHELSTQFGFKAGKIISQPKSYRPFSKR